MTTEPISPSRALTLYLQSRENELAESTHNSHRRRLNYFVEWCKMQEIDNLNELSGRDIHEYRVWRREEGDLNTVSLKTQLSTLRMFLKFLASIDGVHERLHEKIVMPEISKAENTRDEKLEAEDAFDTLDRLRRFEYAEPKHVAFELAWHTGMRTGSLRGLDVADFDMSEAVLEVHHRPEYNTPLKNGQQGERMVALSRKHCRLLKDYQNEKRHDIIEDSGREPLLTTRNGRVSRTQFRRWMYDVTEPPRSPHAIRRGAITYHLLQDWPEADVSERMNVSTEVLKDHYDRRTDRERVKQRRENLKKL